MKALRIVAATIGMLCAAAVTAAAAPNLNHMRAVHMSGNYGSNVLGIRTATSSLLEGAPSIKAATSQIRVSRNSFVDTTGATRTNDSAQVTFTNVSVGSSTTYTKGGVFIIRDVDAGTITVAFRPSTDANLSGISGFSGDVAVTMSADGKTINTDALSRVTGPAREYVLAVLAGGSTLFQLATLTSVAPATFDKAAIVKATQDLQAKIASASDEYWQFLRAENVEWIGISVAMFYDNVSDPTVRLRYAQTPTSFTTFGDTDLQNFIARAKREGFKVYLTLAFETSELFPTASNSAACRTANAKPGRAFLGAPTAPQVDPCVDPNLWWWTPTHPNHAANVATFWSSYTQVAVKYAALSQQWGVEMFSLGTETDNLFRTRAGTGAYTNNFSVQLTQMVRSVRAVYAGILTYDQNSPAIQFPLGSGTEGVFSDLGLDVVGVSAYFTLEKIAPTSVLSVSRFEADWEDIFKNYLVPLQAANPTKPIIFLEFGYSDDVASPFNPSINSGGGTSEPVLPAGVSSPGMQQQQNIYQAFFNVNDRYNNLVRGTFSWDNGTFPAPNYCTKVGWNFYCKPLADTMKAIYARWRDLELSSNLRPLTASAIFSTGQITSQSYVRFFNTGTSSGTVTAVVRDAATGNVIGQWTSPSIAPNAEPQFGMDVIESALGITAKPPQYALTSQSTFSGTFRHVVWNAGGGSLTNLSTCAAGVSAEPLKLAGVHSSLLPQYPSSIVITNTSTTSSGLTLGLYDSRNGVKLGTYVVSPVPAKGQTILATETIEAAIGVKPVDDMVRYVVSVEGSFQGFLQHLVNNRTAGVITDMSNDCSFDTSSSVGTPLYSGVIYSSIQSVALSYLRFYNASTTAGTATVTARNSATGELLGQWTSGPIAPNAEPQYDIVDIERALGLGSKPSNYALSIQATFAGSFRDVVWNAAGGSLTNLSTCAAGVSATPTSLPGLHSSLLPEYPSSVVVNNTGGTATTATFGVYDTRTGVRLGTYKTGSIAPGGQLVIPVTAIESAIGFKPDADLVRYALKVDGTFTGYLQHLVDNKRAGVITDMTTACALSAS